jgi:flagellar biosynthetic protein FliQ
MTDQDVVDLGRQALIAAMLVGAPVLLAGMVVGLVIGLLQALTQIQDQTVSFVPKIVVMLLVVGLCLPWLIEQMVQYSRDLMLDIPRLLMGG